jgi:uncharacterized protein
MISKRLLGIVALLLANIAQAQVTPKPEPLPIGDTFTIESNILKETRRINVYLPAGFAEARDALIPTLYMPDGGMAEDFLHVAGLLQVSFANGTMSPYLLVGIENTERRRDLTPPTEVESDRKIAPRVGGADAFRQFLALELIPEIDRRYRTTPQRAIIGESLAGLFILDTLVEAPELFDTWIAIDPSLWWNKQQIFLNPQKKATNKNTESVFIASSSEPKIAPDAKRFSTELPRYLSKTSKVYFQHFPKESHLTIYHPAALQAIRTMFKPAPRPN